MNLKKALSLFLALCLCVSLLPVAGLADDADTAPKATLVVDGGKIKDTDKSSEVYTVATDVDVYIVAPDTDSHGCDFKEWKLEVSNTSENDKLSDYAVVDDVNAASTKVTLKTASAGKIVTVKAVYNEPAKVKVTFKVENGYWNAYDTAPDAEITIRVDSGTKLEKTDVPAVGQKPADGYKAGAWNVDPTAYAITADTTFTYTYAYITTVDVTFTVVGGTFADGKDTKTITVDEGYVVTADVLPKLGGPDDDHKDEGEWSPAIPEKGYVVTADTEFTFTYKEKDAYTTTVDVTFTVVGGTFADGETSKTISVDSGYVVTADVLPELGGPDDDHEDEGEWSPEIPETGYVVTADTEFTFTYKEKDVEPTSIEYTVTFKVVNGKWDDGTATEKSVTLEGVEGDELKLAADQIPAVGKNPDFGFKSGKWDVTPSTDTAITKDTVYTYTFEKDDTPYGGGGSGATTYKVNVPTETKYGTITATPSSASKGTKVTLKLTPADGFTAVKPTVLDKNGNPIEVTDNGDGTYSFIMPEGDVTVKGGFKGKFVDVEPEDPFFDAVYWAAAKGITLGTDETHFSPNASCTRAMFVTFLWRAAGQPAASGTTCKFVDVLPGTYYYDAVVWAAETGVTLGTDDTHFTPDRVVTRAEAFTFVYRYEKLIGNGFTGLWSFTLDDYADHAEVPEYAYEPFCWMVKEGRIEGNLAPNAVCPRYQIVMLLQSVFG